MTSLTANLPLRVMSLFQGRQFVLDKALLISFSCLLATGFVMMSSASMEYAAQQFGNPWFYVIRQALYIAAMLILMWAATYVPLEFWRKHSAHLLILAFLLLIAVLVPGIGKEVNGSRRWIDLGPFNLQASELAKLFVLTYLAAYLVRREQEVRTAWRGFVKPLLVLTAMIILLLIEPDFGAVVVLLSAALGMMFLAGVRLSHFSFVVLGSLAAVTLMVSLSPYRFQRFTTFLDPWSHQFDSGYQLVQSLIAFGRGEWFGLGLGRSVQKLFYLPEAHTDFVFAIIGEELGFLGAMLVLCLFAILIWRIFHIARQAELVGNKFAAYLAYGIALLFAAQCAINIGVNVGLLPTKGLTLPFFSYGGSSLLVCGVMLALVFRVAFESEGTCQKPS
ncbi:MAG: putative lipid II flippase FtsW [Pseudomonadales bacterium]